MAVIGISPMAFKILKCYRPDDEIEEVVESLKECVKYIRRLSPADVNSESYIVLSTMLTTRKFLSIESDEVQILLANLYAHMFRLHGSNSPFRSARVTKVRRIRLGVLLQ
ncbi:hypothetical protein AB6A40_008442 [Gnathostoma spinigerum]|uniref:Uncharacterized protein n=1 Tax=Gnathostoma spinigerum TaxID=75299 RepID=A0ABD6EXD1_9BILA